MEIHAVTDDAQQPIRLTATLIEYLEDAINELLRDHSNDGADAKGDAAFHMWQDEHE